jgi:hypothetical protein
MSLKEPTPNEDLLVTCYLTKPPLQAVKRVGTRK